MTIDLREEMGRYNVRRERRKPRWAAFRWFLLWFLAVAVLFCVTAAVSGAFYGSWWAFPAIGMLWSSKKAYDYFSLWWGSRTPVSTKIFGDAVNATLKDTKRAMMHSKRAVDKNFYLGVQQLVGETNGEREFTDTGQMIRTGPDGFQSSVLAVGTTGAGKTLGLAVEQIFLNGTLIVVDTGEIAAMTVNMCNDYRLDETGGSIVLNPYGHLVEQYPELESWGYSPLFEIKTPNSGRNADDIDTIFVRKCEILARGAIHRSYEERSTDSHWLDTAEQVYAGLLMWECLDKPPDKRSFGNVRDVITGGPPKIQMVAARALKEYPNLKEIQRKLGRFAVGGELEEKVENGKKKRTLTVEEATGELKSVVSALDTQTRFLDADEFVRDLCPKGGNKFTWGGLKQKKRRVFLILPPDRFEEGKWWLRLLINEAVTDLMSTVKNKKVPVRFVIDEFAHLGRLDSIRAALNLARKQGVSFFLMGQNLPQFERVYGPTALRDIESACGTKICFRTRDEHTAGHFSELCGVRTVTVQSENVHKTVAQDTWQYRPQSVPLWPKGAIGTLPDRTAIVVSSDIPGKTLVVKTPGIYAPELAPWRKHMKDNPYPP